MIPPKIARLLGLAGLLPQIFVVLVLLEHNGELRYLALSLGYAYAALILSFLGGIWWGLAARSDTPPVWLWVVAVIPSLIALGSAVPWATGQAWPGPSLYVLGVSLILSLLVDWRLQKMGLAPPWWLQLRVPLSVGLGTLSLVIPLL